MAASWARRRRERLRPDERPHWTDPDLPCWFPELMFSDGSKRSLYMPADFAQRNAQKNMERHGDQHWTKDPTYDLRRR